MDRLMNQAGLSQDQATAALGTVKDFLTEKFPMMEGIMEKFIGDDSQDGTTESATEGAADGAEGSNLMDQAKDQISNLSEKAGDMMEGLEEKLDDLPIPDAAKDALGKLKDMFGK